MVYVCYFFAGASKRKRNVANTDPRPTPQYPTPMAPIKLYTPKILVNHHVKEHLDLTNGRLIKHTNPVILCAFWCRHRLLLCVYVCEGHSYNDYSSGEDLAIVDFYIFIIHIDGVKLSH